MCNSRRGKDLEQLIAHLIGDYVLQNHWMANNKTTLTWAAVLHGTLYSFPFILLAPSWQALLVIWLTHILIDRFRLAKYWVEFWGVGLEGQVIGTLRKARGFERLELDTVDMTGRPILGMKGPWFWVDDNGKRIAPTPEAPPFLGVWLLIIVDNTLHLTINYLSIRWL